MQEQDGNAMPISFPATVAIRAEREVAVYKNLQLVLLATNKPGYLVSTAMPAPGQGAPRHPFIDGKATWAAAEDELGSLLRESDSFDAYVAALIARGYDLLSIDGKGETQNLGRCYRIYNGDRLLGVAWPSAGQFMTLHTQPAVGELESTYATVTAYDSAEGSVLLKAFTQATDFEQFVKAMKANGFRMQDI